jgi:hypothetical protein
MRLSIFVHNLILIFHYLIIKLFLFISLNNGEYKNSFMELEIYKHIF